MSAGTNIAIANGVGNISVSFTGILAPGQGGTGTSTIPPAGAVLIGDGTNYAVGAVIAGPGINVNSSSAAITVSLAGGVIPPGQNGQDFEGTDFYTFAPAISNAVNLRPPFGAFQDTTTQTAPANTAQVMRFGQTDFSSGISITSHTASFTASIATTTMTVTAATAGSIYLGMTLTGTGVSAGTLVVSQTSGTAGGVGVYEVSISQTVASTTIDGSIASKISVKNAGVYNLQWSGQFINTAAAVHEVSVWLRQDASGAAVDIPGSAGLISIPAKHGAFDGGLIVGWNYYISLAADEYVELWWSTPDVSSYITHYPAGTSPVRPSTASVVATLTFVSAPL